MEFFFYSRGNYFLFSLGNLDELSIIVFVGFYLVVELGCEDVSFWMF